MAALIYGDEALDLFRLDGQDTVYDYQIADTDEAVDWMIKMCHDGECLETVDWRCGFAIDYLAQNDEIDECFYAVKKRAKPWTTLDAIRKYCGKQLAKFTGEYGTKNDCKAEGGSWGKLSPPPHIDFY